MKLYKKIYISTDVYKRQNKYNARFLLSMLAVREVDDDWWPAPACGSLSVNSYGQLDVYKRQLFHLYRRYNTRIKIRSS